MIFLQGKLHWLVAECGEVAASRGSASFRSRTSSIIQSNRRALSHPFSCYISAISSRSLAQWKRTSPSHALLLLVANLLFCPCIVEKSVIIMHYFTHHVANAELAFATVCGAKRVANGLRGSRMGRGNLSHAIMTHSSPATGLSSVPGPFQSKKVHES